MRTVKTSSKLLTIAICGCCLSFLVGLAIPFYAEGDTRPDIASGAPAAISSNTLITNTQLYLPLVMTSSSSPLRRVNAPYFGSVDVALKFAELAIFWFGRVTPTENYADVRVGYNNTELYVYVAAFDRRLWSDTSPSPGDLTAWDSATLYLNLSGNAGAIPITNTYKFEAQLNNCNPTTPDFASCRARYRASYQGNGSGWEAASISFDILAGWRGDALNNNGDDRGWAMTFHIPFASLGLSGPPSQGVEHWGLAMTLHDRDDDAGASIADKAWPEKAVPMRPDSWGQLGFGLPTYTPPPATPGPTMTVRNKLNGVTVTDASVGGYTRCGEGRDFWTQWGETNEVYYNPDRSDFNIQNQSDIADWPCFSKYYITFPLDAIPSGKVILSATVTLFQMGQAGNPGQAQPSLIQALTVAQDWDEATLTWNNAPLAVENISQTWADPVTRCSDTWHCFPRTWDVSGAAAAAYGASAPLRLTFYEADSNQHSGKYFISSNTGDWNETNRPTLRVFWGDPNP